MTTIRYQFTAPEAVKVMLKIRRLNHPWETIKGTLAGTVGAALIVGTYVYRDEGRRPGLAIVGFGLVICLLPVFYFITWFRVRRVFVRRVQSNPQTTSLEELSFDDTKLMLSTASQKQEFTWTVFPSRTQDDFYFYLFAGAGGVFTTIPKRAFDKSSLAEFIRCGRFS